MRRQQYEYPPTTQPRAKIGRFFAMLGIVVLIAVAVSVYTTLQRLNVQALAMMAGGMLVFAGFVIVLTLIIFTALTTTRILAGRSQTQAQPQIQQPILISTQPQTPALQANSWGWDQHSPQERKFEVHTMGGEEE